MRVAVVTPVFNDWPSLSRLIGDIDRIELPRHVEFSLFAIDDGSSEPVVIDYPVQTLHRVREIEIITLGCNLGHQRAIAVGLVETYVRKDFDAIIVMDSDGEDRPSDIPFLLAEAARKPGYIICAQRRRRPGLLIFRMWYECYKLVFRLLTGSRIDFGNYCLIPTDRLEAVVSNSSIWNNLAGTLTRSRLPLTSFPSDRGRRYAGSSKMNFVSLVTHGLSAMAVYSKRSHAIGDFVRAISPAIYELGDPWLGKFDGGYSVNHPGPGANAVHDRNLQHDECTER